MLTSKQAQLECAKKLHKAVKVMLDASNVYTNSEDGAIKAPDWDELSDEKKEPFLDMANTILAFYYI